MTETPRLLFSFLLGTRCENYSRDRAATAIGASIRTTDRALGLLVKLQAIARQRGGRATSAKLTVLMSMKEFLARYLELARYVTKTGALSVETGAPSRVLNLKEEDKERKKPPQMERGFGTEHQPSRFDALPERFGVTEAELMASAAEHEAKRLRMSA